MPGKGRGHHGGHGPMRSQSQWRYLFATHGDEPWVRRWAEEVVAKRGKKTGYHSLPGNKPGNHSARTGTAKQRSRSNAIRKALTGKH